MGSHLASANASAIIMRKDALSPEKHKKKKASEKDTAACGPAEKSPVKKSEAITSSKTSSLPVAQNAPTANEYENQNAVHKRLPTSSDSQTPVEPKSKTEHVNA